MTHEPVKFEDYTREEVQKILDPGSTFKKGKPSWGIYGFIPLQKGPGDFVFFVTFNQHHGPLTFVEGITPGGVLLWQSQHRHTLDHRRIKELIGHNYETSSIFLFLRTHEKRDPPYTYLGKLRYLSHDPGQEHPVHFRWQILDWPIPEQVATRMGLTLLDEEGVPEIIVRPIESVIDIAIDIDEPPQRFSTTVMRIIRDSPKARLLKSTYDFSCQICGTRIERTQGDFYVEVHHIRPLGGGHAGTDTEENMLVLCPNHHAMFDFAIPSFLGATSVRIANTVHKITSRHRIAPTAVEYHNDLHVRKARARKAG